MSLSLLQLASVLPAVHLQGSNHQKIKEQPCYAVKPWLLGWRPSLLGARTLLVAPGIATSNKELLGTKGITTRSKNASRLEAIAISVLIL